MKRFAASVSVEYEEPTPPAIRRVTVAMPPDAASALLRVLQNIAVGPETRGLLSPIARGLEAAGIEPYGGHLKGTIQFNT